MRIAYYSILVFSVAFGFAFTLAAESRRGYGYTNSRSGYVRPTVTRNGNYRSGHYRTPPNSTDKDNYSTSGNRNLWTGKSGSRNSKSLW